MLVAGAWHRASSQRSGQTVGMFGFLREITNPRPFEFPADLTGIISEKIAPGADDAVRSDLRFINHEWVFEASFLIFAVIVHFLEGLICCFTRSTWPLEGFYLYSAPGWPLGPFIFIRTPVPSFRTICQKTKVSIRYSIAFCERGHMTSIDKLWFGLWYDNPKLKRFFLSYL